MKKSCKKGFTNRRIFCIILGVVTYVSVAQLDRAMEPMKHCPEARTKEHWKDKDSKKRRNCPEARSGASTGRTTVFKLGAESLNHN